MNKDKSLKNKKPHRMPLAQMVKRQLTYEQEQAKVLDQWMAKLKINPKP